MGDLPPHLEAQPEGIPAARRCLRLAAGHGAFLTLPHQHCRRARGRDRVLVAIILLAGIAVNLLFAMLVFVVLFSVIGFDVRMQSGEVTHMTVDPGRAIVAGFTYIGMVVQAGAPFRGYLAAYLSAIVAWLFCHRIWSRTLTGALIMGDHGPIAGAGSTATGRACSLLPARSCSRSARSCSPS